MWNESVPLIWPNPEALRQWGVDVLLVTSDEHPESEAARDYELVLDPRFRTALNWPATPAALRPIREYRPRVVIAEQIRDRRWIALAGLAPRIQPVPRWRPPRHRRTTARLRRRGDHCPLR